MGMYVPRPSLCPAAARGTAFAIRRSTGHCRFSVSPVASAAGSSGDQAGIKTARVSFRLQESVPYKTYFKVCGSLDSLGKWDLDKAPSMVWSEGDVWSLEVEAPVGTEAEYKLIKVPRREALKWESGRNRTLVVRDGDEEVVMAMVFDDKDAVPEIDVAVAAAEAAEAYAEEPGGAGGEPDEPQQAAGNPAASLIPEPSDIQAAVLEPVSAARTEPVPQAAHAEQLQVVCSEVAELAEMVLPPLSDFTVICPAPVMSAHKSNGLVVAAAAVEEEFKPNGFLKAIGALMPFLGKRREGAKDKRTDADKEEPEAKS